MRNKIVWLLLASIALLFPNWLAASTVSATDPQGGGIDYDFTVNMVGSDEAVFSGHVGPRSWEDPNFFNAAEGEDPVGRTSASHWIALNLAVRTSFTVRLERDATVPWPSMSDPSRLAPTASLFPSFTLWQNWDNDPVPEAFADQVGGGTLRGDWFTYNNDGAIVWAEDLTFNGDYDGVLPFYKNSTQHTIERTYILPAGRYTLVIGSCAPENDPTRQGYKATFTTKRDVSVEIANDSYFVASAIKPLTVPVQNGVLENDISLLPTDTLEIVSQPKYGQLTANADGSFTYTPGAYFGVAGFDTFGYRLLLNGHTNTPTPAGTATISTFTAAAGAHAGLIRNRDSQEIAGLVKLDVTRLGKWSATVTHLGKRFSLRGAVSLNGKLAGNFKPGINAELNLSTRENGDRQARVRINGESAHFEAQVEKSLYGGNFPPPSKGTHPVALEVTGSSAGAPQAAGSAKLRVLANGTATLAGKLGDKTPFTCSTVLVKGTGAGPALPVYAAIYRKPIGSVSGELVFGADAESEAVGTFGLVKPAQVSPPSSGFTITYGVTTASP